MRGDYDLIGAFFHIFTRDWPTVFPEEWADVEHAGSATVEIGLPMDGEFLYPVSEVEETEMAGADVTAGGADELIATTLDHVDAHVIDEGAVDRAGAAYADVVAGVRATAAAAMSSEQIVPAIVVHHVRCFAVDGQVARLIAGMKTLTGLGIELDLANIAKVRAIDEPKATGIGVEENTRIDSIRLLDTIGGGHNSAFFPLVVRRGGVESLIDQQTDLGMRLTAGVGGVIEIISVTDVNDVRGQTYMGRPRSGAPRPAVIRDQRRAASTVDVILAIALDDGGRIVDADLPGKREGDRSQRYGGKEYRFESTAIYRAHFVWRNISSGKHNGED